MMVQAAFLQADEARNLDLAALAAAIGHRTVTKQAVMNACLRNCCQTTISIQYAIRYIKDFDTPAFFEELVEALLHQPYKGEMLRCVDASRCERTVSDKLTLHPLQGAVKTGSNDRCRYQHHSEAKFPRTFGKSD